MKEPDVRRAITRYRADYLRLKNALHDRATSLPAFPALLQRVRTFLEKHRVVGVLHLRPVRLETVESIYGWQVYDGILARAADVVRRFIDDDLPQGSIAGLDRVAGGEFIVFVPHKPDEQDVDAPFLEKMAERARRRLEQAFDHEDFSGLNPSISFRSGHALLSINPFYRFERCVYAAIEQARSREQRRQDRRVRSLSEELRRIIADSAVRTLFQPIVELEQRRVVGYEALARGPKDSVFETPGAMFSLSSRAGVSAALDRVCRDAALRDSAGFAAGGSLFLNVLPDGLEDRQWLDSAAASNGDGRAGRWQLVLEVSERAIGGDPERFLRAVRRLKETGWSLALDDVGTGYGTLALLERIRPDYLKIDGSIVRSIERHLIKQEVLNSVVQIAGRIGASVIAEGVETEEELATLRSAGAALGQGYLFAVPAPAGRDA